jgi:hypothetical protein
MPDYSVDQELVQFGEGSLTFLEPFWPGGEQIAHSTSEGRLASSKIQGSSYSSSSACDPIMHKERRCRSVMRSL